MKRGLYLIIFTLLITAAFAALPAPSNLKANAESSTEIKLTWNDVSGAVNYTVYKSTKFTGPFNKIKSGIKTESYTDEDLEPDTAYFYRVTVVNSSGESPKSNIANATTLNEAPKTPTGLIAVPATNNRISLFWDKVPLASKYMVYRSLTRTGTYIFIANVSENSYSDSGLTPETTYYYKVKAFNFVGTSSFSNDARATTLPQEVQQIVEQPVQTTVQNITQQPVQNIPQQPQIQTPQPSLQIETPAAKDNTVLYASISLLVLFAVLILIILKIRKPRFDPQLRSYIVENLRRGYTKEQISHVLKQNGHSQKDVDKMMKHI